MKYYVYHLIDPRDNSVFYVGKGTGDRINHHQKDAVRGALLNVEKESRIMEILDSGLKVGKKKIKFFENEDSAYEFERSEIDRIGIDSLTNVSRGQSNQLMRSKAQTEKLLRILDLNMKVLAGKKFYQCLMLADELKEVLEIINEQLRLRQA